MPTCAVCQTVYLDLLPNCPKCTNPNPAIHILKPFDSSATGSGATTVSAPVATSMGTPPVATGMGAPSVATGMGAPPVATGMGAPPVPTSKPKSDLQFLIAAANHRKGVLTTFEMLRGYLYEQYYRRRTSPRGRVSRDDYRTLCNGLVSSDYYRKKDCLFFIEAQTKGNIGRPLGKTRLEDIEAIRHLRKTPRGANVSRITLTFGRGDISKIFSRLAGFNGKYPVINDFKIVGLSAFGQGPDDAIIYLNSPLNSEAVAALRAALTQDNLIQPALAACEPAPLSLDPLVVGVYATDIPTLNTAQAQLLKIQEKFFGSAGLLTCTMAVHIALNTRPASGRGYPGDAEYITAIDELCRYLGLDPTNPSRRRA